MRDCSIKFGTGGWRAVIGDDFIKDNIVAVSCALSQYIKEHGQTGKPVVIGYDRRFLSQEAAIWSAEALASNGISVHFIRRSVPTPLIMHTVKENGLFFGMEITASHNPSEYNGIKIIAEEGRDASVELTDALEAIIEKNKNNHVECRSFESLCTEGMITYFENPFNAYIDGILNLIDTDTVRRGGMRVLIDTMHGSSTYPLMIILCTARCTVDFMNLNKDAYFGGMMPAPSRSNLVNLSGKVVRGKYDLGLALDGDGDRLGIIDRNGEYIDANAILVMLYWYLHEVKGWKGGVVRNLATTHMLDRLAEDFGEKCYEVPIGFKYISSKIDEVDALLGGESSGGLTVRGHIHGKDSVYAASLFIEMVSALGKDPSEIYRELREKYGKFELVENNLRFDANDKESIVKLLITDKCLPDFGKKIVRVNYEDGCKVYFDDNSFVICRFSGTESLLRIFAEAENEQTSHDYATCFGSFIETKLGITLG